MLTRGTYMSLTLLACLSFNSAVLAESSAKDVIEAAGSASMKVNQIALDSVDDIDQWRNSEILGWAELVFYTASYTEEGEYNKRLARAERAIVSAHEKISDRGGDDATSVAKRMFILEILLQLRLGKDMVPTAKQLADLDKENGAAHVFLGQAYWGRARIELAHKAFTEGSKCTEASWYEAGAVERMVAALRKLGVHDFSVIKSTALWTSSPIERSAVGTQSTLLHSQAFVSRLTGDPNAWQPHWPACYLGLLSAQDWSAMRPVYEIALIKLLRDVIDDPDAGLVGKAWAQNARATAQERLQQATSKAVGIVSDLVRGGSPDEFEQFIADPGKWLASQGVDGLIDQTEWLHLWLLVKR